MLVDMAVGDAYAAPFEFVPLDKHHPNTGRSYYKHPELPLGGGKYTDDAAQASCVAQVIMGYSDPTPLDFAHAFTMNFHNNPRAGYAKGFVAFMENIRTGEAFLKHVRNNSSRSGAAMRAGPIGLYSDKQKIRDVAQLQASITHHTPEAIEAAQAVALTTHYLAYDCGPLEGLGEFLEDELGNSYPWSMPWIEMTGHSWVTVEALECAHAAITALSEGGSQTEILRRCVALGGDVDTVAAIAMFPSSLSTEIERDLDSHLYEALENGDYGRDFLIGLDRRLMAFARLQGATIPE